MASGTWVEIHWSGFTGDALKADKLLVKLRFTEEAAKSTVGDDLYSGEEIEHLDDDMWNSFVQKCRKTRAEQKRVVLYMMAEVFLKLLVWILQYMKRVSRKIDIDTIDI